MIHERPLRKRAAPRGQAAQPAATAFPSRQDVIAKALRNRILHGELGSGSRLDIDEIAATHGVSRTPVRDALKQLEAEGLVQVFPYRGVEVTTLTAADLEELFGIRIALEQLCMARVVERVRPEDLEAMRRILQRMDRLKKRDQAWGELNTAFHNAIYDASGWPRLAEMLRTQRVNVERYVRARAGDLGIGRQQVQHWAIVEALAARDAAAAQAAIRAHYADTAAAMSLPPPGSAA